MERSVTRLMLKAQRKTEGHPVPEKEESKIRQGVEFLRPQGFPLKPFHGSRTKGQVAGLTELAVKEGGILLVSSCQEGGSLSHPEVLGLG